ncbi:DUF3658 domain-containing protein [Anaerosacchariphilus polymeriproducens]|uniref:DUF1835 domain-containing protein n=1 Tax=Anaerosacchariphilus polymeriproducens TaxID=1812858 RepID=A0A371AVC9_9FIRM|nr:DUF3658 domain-containing protein [Anaerosacchariphilus polymeriproducens]RDU23526.1 DUF1835 domain-containing protein [Anaerosacchariphilus polymeriproducens]
MIELAFNDSTAGALKIAKTMKKGEKLCCTAVFGGTEEEQAELMKPQIPGSQKDIIPLMLELEIGLLNNVDKDWHIRKKILNDLFGNFPGVVEELWQRNISNMKSLQDAKNAMEPIRMWVCDSAPSEMCGLLFICHYMMDANVPLSVVFIPHQIQEDNIITYYRNSGEVLAEQFGKMLEYEKSINRIEKKSYATIWKDLVSENAPLRAILNGTIISVPEDFYDSILRKNIPKEEFIVARIIGKTLNQIPGVSDRWLFLRIQEMVRTGELVEIAEQKDDCPYSGVLKWNLKEDK